MDIFNGYRIYNPDGILNENFDEWKKPFSSENCSYANEATTSEQQELSKSDEIYNAGKTGSDNKSADNANASQSGTDTDGRNSSVASSLGTLPAAPALSVTSAVGSGIGAAVGTFVSSLVTAMLVVAVFVSVLSIKLSLVMADVDRLVVQVDMEGAQDEDFLTPIVAVLDGKNGVHIEQNILPDTRYLTFDGLAANEEYHIRVQSGEKLFEEKSFVTAATRKEKGSVTAYTEGKNVFIVAKNIALGPNEIYTVIATDSAGNKLFGEDSIETNKTFTFTLDEPKDVYITLDIGGEVYSVCEIKMRSGPAYDFEKVTWKWTDDFKASISFAEINGGSPLVIAANVAEKTTVEPGCETSGEKTYTATVRYNNTEYSDVKTAVVPALGHSYGTPKMIWTENENGYTAVLEFTCKRDGHKETVDADISVSVVEPTCEKDGYIEYFAIASFNGEEYGDGRTKPIAALGHEYGAPEFIWTKNEDAYTAAAEFTCIRDGHKETVEAEVVSVKTEPTDDENGDITYTATVSYGGADYSDVKTVIIPALEHEYGEPIFIWTKTDDGYKAIAEFTCIIDGDKQKIEATVVSEVTDPTCEKDGFTTYTATVDFGDDVYSEEKVVVDKGSALGHDYGEPTFTWTATADGYTAKAKFVCANNISHTVTVDAEVVAVATDPTCEKDGYTTYTATAVLGNDRFTEDKIVVKEKTATGHDYGEPTFTWTATADGYTAKAKFVCANDSSHTVTVDAEVVAVASDPTCEKDGYTTYTATAIFADERYTEDKVITHEDTALGHDYGEPTFTWTATADGYTAKAKFVCANDSSHTVTVDAEVVAVATDPTCEKDGYTTYTATAILENTRYTEDKVITHEDTALGHDYGEPAFTWTATADGYTAKAKFVCANDSSHTVTVDAEVVAVATDPTCENDGYTTYTATVIFADERYTEDKVITHEDTATGHDYGEPTFTWTATADGYTAKAKFVCANDSNHTVTVDAEVVAVATDPTCEKDGYTTYTATAIFADERYTEDKVITHEDTALGHDYGEPTFTWTATADGYTAKAKFVCANDSSHTVTVDAEVVAVETDPTCEKDGYTTYTATAIFADERYTEDKVITHEDTATGHDYSQYYEGSNYRPTFVWTENADGSYSAKAVFCCKNDSSHTIEVDAEIGVEDGADCTEGGNMYYYADVTFNDFNYTDEKIVEVAPGHHLIPVFHWVINDNGYTVELCMVCSKGDYHEDSIAAELNVTETDEYTLYTATAVYNEKEYTDSKKVMKTEKALKVGEVYRIGDTIIIDGTTYFSDDCDGANRTSMSGSTPLIGVGSENGTTDATSYDAIMLRNDLFVRMDDSGWAAGETPEWLFTPSDSLLVGVYIESGSGTASDPYILKPVYGVKVTYEANDGVFNMTSGYSVTQYYTEQEVTDGVYANPIAENPESSGRLFLGWFTDEYSSEKFDFENTPITETITLYAGWIGI